jgi:hypothetical protein
MYIASGDVSAMARNLFSLSASSFPIENIPREWFLSKPFYLVLVSHGLLIILRVVLCQRARIFLLSGNFSCLSAIKTSINPVLFWLLMITAP